MQPRPLILAWSVTKAIQNFEAVFQAEMGRRLPLVGAEERGSYTARAIWLMLRARLLPEHHWIIGDGVAEYRNAGRCFAFGLWTAAGYRAASSCSAHLLLSDYWPDEEGKTWRDLINRAETTILPIRN